MFPTKDDLRMFPVISPLLAAIFAPLSTLMDVPALTAPWSFQANPTTGAIHTIADSRASLALSCASLALSFLANALLILRFSVSDVWRRATHLSLVCWIIKFGIEFGNVTAFGIISHSTPNIRYGEGFWCAVMSLALNFIIVSLLSCHYIFQFHMDISNESPERRLELRLAGRQFMLLNTTFVLTIGLVALFMSKVEDWSYLDGIYFTVVSFLLIGLGDFVPTKAISRTFLFPFELIGVVQLAVLVDFIVRVLVARRKARRAARRREFENLRLRSEAAAQAPRPNLEEEIIFLQSLYQRKYGSRKVVEDVVVNVLGIGIFWTVGAIFFSEVETWTYGEGYYFCFEVFSTLGYGDFHPVTAPGRVGFVVYALISVPIVTSFAVQAVVNVYEELAAKVYQYYVAKAGLGQGAKYAEKLRMRTETLDSIMARRYQDSNRNGDQETGIPQARLPSMLLRSIGVQSRQWRRSHADYVAEEHERLESYLSTYHGSDSRAGVADFVAERVAEMREAADEDKMLTQYVLELAIDLEKHARRLMLGHMPDGSRPWTLLKADRIVQLNDIRLLIQQCRDEGREDVAGAMSIRDLLSLPSPIFAIGKEAKETGLDGHLAESSSPDLARWSGKGAVMGIMRNYYEEECELLQLPSELSDRETLDEVMHYRETFAGLLAAGSRLLKLKKEEKYLFERRFRSADSSSEVEKASSERH